MNATTQADPNTFVDRRNNPGQSADGHASERRQFANGYSDVSPDAAELARAIDEYKVRQHRRFITFEEMLAVIHSLGYRRHV